MIIIFTGLKVNYQLVTYATRFLAVSLKGHVWLHHCTLKAKATIRTPIDKYKFKPGTK